MKTKNLKTVQLKILKQMWFEFNGCYTRTSGVAFVT
jgi:hypothetical protein